MRILAVGNMYPPHSLGGYELVWRSAVEHLRSHGHEVRVLASDLRFDGIDDSGDRENDVHRELLWYWRDHEFPRPSLRRRLRTERRNSAVLARHVGELEPDVVAWWSMGGMSLSLIERTRREGRPAAAIVCEDWPLYGTQVDAWSRAFASRPRAGSAVEALTGIPTRVDLPALGPWLFPSESLRDRVEGALGPLHATVCPQGVDLELFEPAPAMEWGWRLAYVGRIDPRKGIGLAIDALDELPAGASLRVVGEGDPRHAAELRARAARHGDRVTFARFPRAQIPEVYGRADAVVFPVLWEEPWGLVPLEAMAVGRPVVVTGRGGSGEYLRDGENCLLFDPGGGAAALAEALRRLAADAELRARLREGGLDTVRRIDPHAFDRAVERTLTAAVSGAP